jgi:asparagine synthase (glutamine-hydrolysing)
MGRTVNMRSVLRHTLPENMVRTIRHLRRVAAPGVNAEWFESRGINLCDNHRAETGCRLHDLLKQSLLETLPSLLRFEDRNAMAFSVENRVPFLVTALVEFVFSLPEEEVISREGRCKAVLLRAMQGLVPGEVLERRDKIGFAMPLSKLNRQAATWLQDSLREADAVPALNGAEVKKHSKHIFDQRAGDSESERLLWRWASFLAWVREFHVCFG